MQPLEDHEIPAKPPGTSGRTFRARSTTSARATQYPASSGAVSDGIGWRNDKIFDGIAKDGISTVGHLLGVAEAGRARSGLLDDYRDGPEHADAARRDSRARVVPDLNAEDPAIIAKAGKDLEQLTAELQLKIAITDYQTLPEAKTWLHHSWSGDLLSGAFYYMPKARVAGRPVVLVPRHERRRAERPTCSCPATPTKPALAHTLPQLHAGRDERVPQLHRTSSATRRRRTPSTPTR